MLSSQNIIVDIKQGNKDSFKEFFDDFYPILCSFANKFLKNPNQSKDAAQEALVKFWEKRKEFDDIQGVKSFLYVVVKNNCLNVLKKSKNNVDLSLLKELESESFFKKNIINQETFMIVRNAINKLPSRQKEIIELSLRGLKNPEIATQLEISPHTVHTAKKNAYRKLREILKDKYYLLLLI
ncbi:RNA polymerase sigma factor [Flavivirga spongiicola]|uniref:RNA polymerase sigma factor SigS n=1 Tax=Flavivirga spongiicola TaxID=421621 RepID=A0ABU7XLT7_9FLAO|nr:RNA polymerase sigma-70 factor [Flavivirga sp. MEBiC05379]MDO5981386.1 RNA polymerase sigma-70 factor [Flavivirga sp. MEBiC05379]